MAVRRKVIAALLSCMFLLSGCEPGVHELQQQNAQQQQQIARLESALAQARAGAIQEDLAELDAANVHLAYKWAGPLRWLPIWPPGADQSQHAPDWKGYLLLASVWSGLLLFLAALMSSAWLTVWLIEKITRKTGLEYKIKQLEAHAGPLRDLQKSLQDTRSEIERIEAKKRSAQAGLDEIERSMKSRTRDLTELEVQCADLRKEAEQLRDDIETLRGFS